MYLTHQERRTLQLAADKSNQALERIVAGIRAANPGAFHTKESLSERVFHHKPEGHVPYRGYMRD
ncbi:hypothetical protein PQR02_07830 [Paraburkholderia sediminicola]|uniref:Uncharacterized protein n=1 Tax=Paraburkholderia rhynchosiae TaxID=487049 RepID=A0ACC7NIY1_9BURK